MNLHPELVKLRAQYERIVADYTAGHIDDETAKGTLLSMRVFDASGFAWGINLDGQFIRQRTPQDAPEVVPPTLFAMPQTGGASQPGRAPWEEAREAGVPFARPVVDPGPPQPSLLERAEQKLRNRTPGTGGGRVGALLRENKVTALVGVGLVLLLVLAKVGTGGDTTPSGSTVAGSTSPQSTVAGVSLPDAAAFQAALPLLRDRPAAVAVLGEKGSASSAFWAGFNAAGLSARLDGITGTPSGADVTLVVIDAASSVELGRIVIPMVPDAAGWRIGAWPDLSAIVTTK